MSWSATARGVRDSARPLGYRVTALHSLLANHHAPLGFEETREELRRRVGASPTLVSPDWAPARQSWTEAQLLEALMLLEESRVSHLTYRNAWAERRSVEKRQGRRQPTKEDLKVLDARSWLLDPNMAKSSPPRPG